MSNNKYVSFRGECLSTTWLEKVIEDVGLSTFPRKCVCLREHGGNFEKCEVICVDYGVWGMRGDPIRIWGVGGALVPDTNLTYPHIIS